MRKSYGRTHCFAWLPAAAILSGLAGCAQSLPAPYLAGSNLGYDDVARAAEQASLKTITRATPDVSPPHSAIGTAMAAVDTPASPDTPAVDSSGSTDTAQSDTSDDGQAMASNDDDTKTADDDSGDGETVGGPAQMQAMMGAFQSALRVGGNRFATLPPPMMRPSPPPVVHEDRPAPRIQVSTPERPPAIRPSFATVAPIGNDPSTNRTGSAGGGGSGYQAAPFSGYRSSGTAPSYSSKPPASYGGNGGYQNTGGYQSAGNAGGSALSSGVPPQCQAYVQQAKQGNMSATYKAAACLEAAASMQLPANNPDAQALAKAANQNAQVVNSLKSQAPTWSGNPGPSIPDLGSADQSNSGDGSQNSGDAGYPGCPPTANVCAAN